MTKLEDLSPNNFLSVCDVTFDIKEELQMTSSDTVWIPIFRNVVRFQVLFPMDGANYRDNYCTARNKGIRYLKDNDYILDYSFKYGSHNWDTRVKISIDRKKFDEFYSYLNKVYDKRVVMPNKSKVQLEAEQELEKLKKMEEEIKDREKNPKKYEEIRQESIKKKQAELKEIYSAIDYTSKAERKGWKKKWDVLQVIWSAYTSASKIGFISIPSEKLTAKINISKAECENILKGFEKKEGFVGNWYEKHSTYFFVLYIHNNKLIDAYDKIKQIYEKFSKEYQKSLKSDNQKIIFHYNPETGDGQLENNKFRLTDGTNYKKLFDACFAIRSKKLTKEDVIKILGLNNKLSQDGIDTKELLGAIGANPLRRKSNQEIVITNAINKEVKAIRSKAGLNNQQFVNNSGNITLSI